MTRKDYQLIANALNETCQSQARLNEHHIETKKIVLSICTALQKDNEKFDSVKFLDAVYK